ncbi:NADH-quinone oxidoreductase subunit J [Reichenbachiella carrageenanivorans]|uniref:NADH-quinone oxidoreductase subunit J n=1 Tax=Reichenbachiella carrageenanivorans TaxID=2979869 RepID=A0ABY6D367_9BACT|nr:NADH-quinone oxidoreductase subunit J [Reichenbachiella carrageenanivorans]UXX79548.1 NADH-quinone oxidoreductase subunit J [Reichenbachiella carrageenanivorans]
MEGIDLNIVAFYILAGFSVFSALGILFAKNIVHAVFLLVLVFLGIAGVFIISNAEFVGVTQIMIYIGGVLILMMFGIMLTHRIDGQRLETQNRGVLLASLLGLALLGILLYPMQEGGFPLHDFGEQEASGFTVTQQIGIHLMTTELVALEITAVLLLMALIGAAYISGLNLKKKRANDTD